MVIIKVQEWMTPRPYCTSPDSSVGEVWGIMVEHGLQRVPVVDRGRLLAIITRNDIGRQPDINRNIASAATRWFVHEPDEKLSKMKVRDVLPVEQQLITIHLEANIEQAAAIMRYSKVGGLPVVDDEGRLMGIITRSDLFKAFFDLLGINRSGTRIRLRLAENLESSLVLVSEIMHKNQVRVENLVVFEPKQASQEIMVRIDTIDSRNIIKELEAAGFAIESVTVKQQS